MESMKRVVILILFFALLSSCTPCAVFAMQDSMAIDMKIVENQSNDEIKQNNIQSSSNVKMSNIYEKVLVSSSEQELTSTRYVIDKQNLLIKSIPPETDITYFKTKFSVSANDVKVYEDTSCAKEVTSGIVTTEMAVKIANTSTVYRVCVIGDLNNDGKMAEIELNKVIKHVVGLKEYKLTGLDLTNADINQDDKVNQIDITATIRWIVYKELNIPACMDDTKISLAENEYTYDGTAKEPIVTVTEGTKKLVKDVDYTASYSNNINAGTATVTVTGKGEYIGSKTARFTINKKTINIVAKGKTKTYGEQNPVLDYNCIGVVSGQVAKLTGNLSTLATTNSDVGSYDINIGNLALENNGTFLANNYKINYTKATLTITSKSASTLTVELSQNSYTYDGTEKTPTVTVKDGNKTLLLNTHYTMKYENNIKAGTARVVIFGNKNYSGAKFALFNIDKATNPTKITSKTGLAYEGIEQELVTVEDLQGTVYFSTNNVLTSSNYTSGTTIIPKGKEATYYTVYYYVQGGTNYKDISGSLSVRISTLVEVDKNITAVSEAQLKKSDGTLYTWDELEYIANGISNTYGKTDGITNTTMGIKVNGKFNGETIVVGNWIKVLHKGVSKKVRIIGFNHDDKADGSGKAGISFEFVNILDANKMNATDTDVGGWGASQMRKNMATYLNDLEKDLKDVIKPVNKNYNYGYDDTDLNGTTKGGTNAPTGSKDSLWILSYNEMMGDIPPRESEGSTYCFYNYYNSLNNTSCRIKYAGDITSTSALKWWLRTPFYSAVTDACFYTVEYTGKFRYFYC